MLDNLIQDISKVVLYNTAVVGNDGCAAFVISQINRSPLHIKFGLKILAIGFLCLSLIYGLGSPFFLYKSQYRKIRFIEIFEKICKPTRMFISFIRSMSLIYVCDHNLI